MFQYANMRYALREKQKSKTLYCYEQKAKYTNSLQSEECPSIHPFSNPLTLTGLGRPDERLISSKPFLTRPQSPAHYPILLLHQPVKRNTNYLHTFFINCFCYESVGDAKPGAPHEVGRTLEGPASHTDHIHLLTQTNHTLWPISSPRSASDARLRTARIAGGNRISRRKPTQTVLVFTDTFHSVFLPICAALCDVLGACIAPSPAVLPRCSDCFHSVGKHKNPTNTWL